MVGGGATLRAIRGRIGIQYLIDGLTAAQTMERPRRPNEDNTTMSDLTDRANALVTSTGSVEAAQAVAATNIGTTFDAEQSEWLFVNWLICRPGNRNRGDPVNP